MEKTAAWQSLTSAAHHDGRSGHIPITIEAILSHKRAERISPCGSLLPLRTVIIIKKKHS